MIKKIAHITDLHLDEDFPFKNPELSRKRFDRVLRDIETEKITHIVCTGDIGENKGIQYFFEQLKSKTLSLTLGNHDTYNKISKYYNVGTDHSSKKIYYNTLETHYKFIYLDSSEGIIDHKQLIWLQKELISSNPIILFIHHPIIGLGLKVDEIGRLKNRDRLTTILTEITNNVTIYCGHYHMESYVTYKNIKQYITPAVSFQIKKNPNDIEIDTSTSGYRIIHIEKNKISSKVKLLNNAE